MTLKTERCRSPRYPNGSRKSRLYEVFLCYRDFRGCTPKEYEEGLAFIHQEEVEGQSNCSWYKDEDGKLVVDDLQLNDQFLRVVIIEDSFELMPRIQVPACVFISYAREDYDAARRLADEISRAGFRIWFDRDNLIPGEPWEIAISCAIRSSDFVVALLSRWSVTKRGFVQREIRHALDVLDEFPEPKIFLIPARLEPCEPTHLALLKLHWVDLFPRWEDGISRLLAALRTEPCSSG